MSAESDNSGESTYPKELDYSKIYLTVAKKTQITKPIVVTTIKLLEDGNTIPFIARYRKEVTHGLDEIKLRELQKEYNEKRNLEERKISVLGLIDKQEKLTPELQQKIIVADVLQEVEDLYLPFKPKLRTLGAKARAKGLEPLADMIRANTTSDTPLKELANKFVDPEKKVKDVSEALKGAVDIIAEDIGSDPELRKFVREVVFNRNSIKTEVNQEALNASTPPKTPEGKVVDPHTYENYFNLTIPGYKLQPYQILAVNRAQKYGVIEYTIETPEEDMIHELEKRVLRGHNRKSNQFFSYFKKAVQHGFKRYIIRSIKREYWNSLIEKAETHAISVFAENLKNLLLTPPLKYRGVIGIDPGFRTGCKVAVINEFGTYLDNGNIYPHAPQKKWREALQILHKFTQKHNIATFAVGNGTASRETEELMAEFNKTFKQDSLSYEYAMVNEAGASVYSASELAHEEFPDLDATVRGAISIARRLQDPLSELIKIDPKSIGVGLYQHDVNQVQLKQELDAVIEDCVNGVGVDVNTASSRLLEYVSGLTYSNAKRLVEYRQKNGPFKSRDEFKTIRGIGDKTFEQCAGFLKIRDAENVLDGTFIHPEAYDLTLKIFQQAKSDIHDILEVEKQSQFVSKLNKLNLKELAAGHKTDLEKIKYLIDQLQKPNLDPRDSLDEVILRQDVKSIDDLKEGMVLRGTIRNVVDFGAFVDIGVKHNGLVHRSEIANQFVKDPRDFLAVGEVHDFMILLIDKSRNRIQLSLKQVPKIDSK